MTFERAELFWGTTGTQALAELTREQVDLVICDIQLPDMNGEDVFSQLAGTAITPPFLFFILS